MLDDFVGESPTAGFFGTGPITLAGATSPFTTRFRDARHGATGSKWLLCARTTSAQPAANGTKYMIFEGTFTYGATDQVSVDTVYQSSAGYGTAVTWVASDVFVVFAAPSLEALSGVLQYDVDRGSSTPTLGLTDSGSVNHFDVTAANRTLNLPAGSTVNRFYRVGVTAYGGTANYVAVTPNGADTIAGVTGAARVYGNTGTRYFRWSTTMGKWIPEMYPNVTGTGATVLANSPTLTGTLSGASAVFSGTVTGTGSISALKAYVSDTTQTSISLRQEGMPTDKKTWEFLSTATSGDLIFRTINDAYSASSVWLKVFRSSGYTLSGATLYPALTLSNALTYGGVTLSNSVTGTGSMVLSDSPTVTTKAIINGVQYGSYTTGASVGGDGSNMAFRTYASGGIYLQSSAGTTWADINASRLSSAVIIQPSSDNALTLGAASFRWSTIYAGTGTINTSGRDAKVGIREATAAERRAARRILEAGPKLYKFKDAVDVKGDAARLHAGYIAEDVRDALEAEGLDPWSYGFMCSDPITTVETYTETVSRPKMRKVTTTENGVEVIDGKAVMVARIVEREEPVGRMVPVVDENGQPIMQPVMQPPEQGEEYIDDEGNTVTRPPVHREPEMEPMMHFLPDTEEVEETRTREVPLLDTAGQPVMRLGLRYSELEAFLKVAA